MSDGDLIVRVAARGDGVTADGRHVPLSAPGDRVGEGGELLWGEHHIQPPCRHFPRCGGCQLQHLDDASYSDFLRDRVRGALAAQGLEAPLRPPALSPPWTRRRATLHAERRGGGVLLGFTEEASHRIVDMAECHILHPRLFALVEPLRALLKLLLPGRGRADVHLALSDQGPDVLLKGVAVEGLAAAEAVPAFAQSQGLARLAIDEGYGAEARWEPVPVTVALGGLAVPLPPGAFLQATEEGEAALVAAAREAVGDARTMADLFAGLGTFAFAFPQARILAVEAAREALLALKAAAACAGRAVAADHRDLFRRPLTGEELARFDAVVLDPPRAGAREQAGQLARSPVPRIAYISCNPSSFARDAKTLCEGGYRLDWVVPVGQFRWSTHIELAACFTRQG